MGSGNLTPLEELKRLDQQVDEVTTLSGLQPLFARVEELTKANSADFEVQLVAHDVRQHILARGSWIKRTQPAQAPAPLAAAPPPINLPQPSAAAEPGPSAGKRRLGPLLWVAATLFAVAAAAIGVNVLRDRNRRIAETTPIDASISTVPPRARIAVNGQDACLSDCVAPLTPGTYQVTATLEGYESASAALTVTAGQPASLALTLTPLDPSLHIFADLASGRVFLDDQPAGDLQDGQFLIERLPAGLRKIRITGGNAEAAFTVNAAPASFPVIEGPVTTRNLLAAVVSNFGGQAKLVTSSGPLKLTLNGQPQADASPEGTPLTGFRAGPAELQLGEGNTRRILTGTFTSAPTVTAFLKTDEEIGTLLISTGQDDVRIYLNNREHRRRTQKGQARVQAFGDVTVRVEKAGFEPVPPQTVNVAKGAEVRINFTLKEIPRIATLAITGGTPGSEVLLDQRSLGVLGPDGAFRNTRIPAGEHSIELRREQFEPKRFTRTFRTGETVTITAAEATLAAVPVALPPAPTPPPPKPETLPPKPAVPKIVATGVSAFDDPGAWREQDGIWRHRGSATLTFRPVPHGIFTFSIYMLRGGGLFGSGKVRWVMQYIDSKHYSLFELDPENFWSKVVVNGKTLDRKKVAHKQDKNMRVWNIQIDATPDRLIHKIQGDNGWQDLDTWTEPGRDFTQGKFGILVTGNDEVGLSNFTFTAR